ncbi:MAG: flippase-like domain-containing protein [Chitinophagales bacterium]|nr:flippase-like domain-containing protein [Chitinophagales bacterium]
MHPKLKSFLKILIPFIIGFGLIYLFYRKITPEDKQEIVAALKEINYLMLLISTSFTLFSDIFRSWRFKNLIDATGQKITFMKAFHAVNVNYIVNLGIPRAGELARCGVLATYDKIPINKSLGVLINERIVDVILLVFVGGLTLLFQYNIFVSFYTQYMAATVKGVYDWFFLHPFLAVLIGLALIVSFYFFTRFLFSKNKSNNIVSKIADGFKDGILSIVRLERPMLFIFQSLAIWACYFFMIYFALKTLPQSSVLPIGAVLALLFFGTFGFLATPGGIGAYQLVTAYTLALYGLPVHIGSTVGWVNWIGQTILILCLGLFSFFYAKQRKS